MPLKAAGATRIGARVVDIDRRILPRPRPGRSGTLQSVQQAERVSETVIVAGGDSQPEEIRVRTAYCPELSVTGGRV